MKSVNEGHKTLVLSKINISIGQFLKQFITSLILISCRSGKCCVHCPVYLRLNPVPDSCSESRMLRMEAILSAVAGLTVSWSSIFSRDPNSFTSRSIITENHKTYEREHLIQVCITTGKYSLTPSPQNGKGRTVS